MATSNKKLWIISELFPPEETSTAYIIGEIANAFSQKYDVNVICGPEIYDKKKGRVNNKYCFDDIKLFRASAKTYNKNTFLGKIRSLVNNTLSLYRLAKKNIKSDDKVLLVTNPAPLPVLMSRLRMERKFELNILVHDVFPENIKAAGFKIPMYNKLERIFSKAYSKSDQLIVIGRDMADVLSKKTKKTVPIKIIENWGDFDNIHPKDMPSNSKIVLQYAGNIGRVQGLEDIILQLPENIDFHIYGSGAIEEKLKNLSKKNVFFHGPYARAEQSEILGACHISLVTINKCMYGLGTPSKTYNILAAGRPILYFGPKDSEIELLIKEHNIGFCGWPEHWDIEQLRTMGVRAREIGEKLYSKGYILNKFIETI